MSVPSSVTQRESAAAATPITASLAAVIVLIVLLLIMSGIVLGIIKTVRRKSNRKDTRVKYISSEGGYLDTEDSSRVDGGFDNRVVSF